MKHTSDQLGYKKKRDYGIEIYEDDEATTVTNIGFYGESGLHPGKTHEGLPTAER